MSTENATTTKTRIITVYSSQGKNGFSFSFTGIYWEELKPILKNHGYNVDSMRVIENTRKGVLEHPKAMIPEVDFNLHLYPKATKGGAKKSIVLLSRGDITTSIKKHIAVHGDKAKKHFSEDKSYTNKTTEELDKLLTKWEKKHGSAPDVTLEPTRKRTAKKSTEEVEHEAIPEGKAEAIGELLSPLTTPKTRIESAVQLLKGISGHENQVNIEKAITELQKALIEKPTPSQEELLRKEHEELASGLEGISRY